MFAECTKTTEDECLPMTVKLVKVNVCSFY